MRQAEMAPLSPPSMSANRREASSSTPGPQPVARSSASSAGSAHLPARQDEGLIWAEKSFCEKGYYVRSPGCTPAPSQTASLKS